MNKKYELTETTSIAGWTTMHQIRALRDITLASGQTVAKGDLGGWVEHEDNLSQDGNCWVGQDARVMDKACVSQNAYVGGTVCMINASCACDDAIVDDDAVLQNDCVVRGQARVNGYAIIRDKAVVGGRAHLGGRLRAGGDAHIENATLFNGRVGNNAKITKSTDIFVLFDVSNEEPTTFYKCANGKICVSGSTGKLTARAVDLEEANVSPAVKAAVVKFFEVGDEV